MNIDTWSLIQEYRQYPGEKIVASADGTEAPKPVDIHVKKGARDIGLKGA